MLTEAEINQALEKLEREYLSDRDALLRMKRLVSRDILSQSPASTEAKVPKEKPAPLAAQPEKGNSGSARTRSNRDIVRSFIAAAGELFTSSELMMAAKKSGDHEAANLKSAVWSSSLSYLKDLGHIEMVHEGVGRNPATYRLAVSAHDLLNPGKNRRQQQSPLKDLVQESVSSLPLITFNRKDLYDHLVFRSPELAERYKLDVVGAVLNRLANNENGVRIISRETTGNTYEKIK